MKKKQKRDIESSLKGHIEKASNILLVTHKIIDRDGIASLLMLSKILAKYLKKTNITSFVQERTWPQFTKDEFPAIENVKNIPYGENLDPEPFDLIFILDAFTFERCIDMKDSSVAYSKTIVIDHHISDPKEEPLLYINEKRSSTVEQIYSTFKKITPSISKDKAITRLLQIGIMTDTNRFLYSELLTKETFEIMGEAFETNPVNIEQFYNNIVSNSRNSISIFENILKNITFKDDMAYSFISPQLTDYNKYSDIDYESARRMFLQFYVRTLEGVNWAFIVRGLSKPKTWYVSFRATLGTRNVNKFSEHLGGGGHYNASGATIKAETIEEAIQKVLDVIEKK